MAYFDKFGVEFTDDRKTLVRCPEDFKGEYIIPDGVTSIGDNAFLGCSSLTTVIIPDSVSYIGISAFEECTSLFAVTIPDSVTSIGRYTFAKCSSLNSVSIGYSVRSIGWGAFEECSRLTSIKIPNSVKRIGYGAFRNCSNLTSVKIPNSIISIEDVAFYGCSCLVSIQIPNPIINIGENAFAYVPNIVCTSEILGFPWGAKNANGFVDGSLVYSDSTKSKLIVCSPSSQGEITVPDGITSIGDYAFQDCSGLTSVTIPDSVTSIGWSTFEGCSGLREIIVPHGQKARFEQMEGLKDLKDKIIERDNEELTVLFNLGKAYELGIGVTQSSAQAILYFIQAAEKGSNEAAFHLGEWYREGKNVPRDEQKALTYFQQAAKSGFAKAAEQVNAIEQNIAARKEEEEAKKRQEEIERLKKQELEQERQRQKVEQEKPYYLFFDTETAGLPPKGKYDVPVTDPDFWPRLVQIAWILTDKEGKVLNRKSKIIYPNGFSIPASATAIHHITTEHAMQVGEPLRDVLGEFMRDLLKAEKIVCHYVEFDQHIVGAELYSMDMDYKALMDKSSICTMTSKSIIDYCALPNPNGYDDYKWPKLSELYRKLFNRDFENAHDALADITATKDCFFELKRRGIIKE